MPRGRKRIEGDENFRNTNRLYGDVTFFVKKNVLTVRRPALYVIPPWTSAHYRHKYRNGSCLLRTPLSARIPASYDFTDTGTIANRQRGVGKLDYNEAFDDREYSERKLELVPDKDPHIEKMKREYLLAKNDYDTVLHFSKMRELQHMLANHLTLGTLLLAGTTVFSITNAIRKIKLDYKDGQNDGQQDNQRG